MITLLRAELAAELAIIGQVVKAERTIDVLTHVLVEFDGQAARLTGSSVDVTITSKISGKGEPWSGCIPWKQLTALSRALDSETVTLTPKDGRIQVKGGASKTLLCTLAVDQFPSPETILNPVTFTVDGKELREGLKRVLPCVTREESRYAMAGVNFEARGSELRLVATDGFRLGVVTLPISETTVTTLIPEDGLRPLLALESETITIQLSNSHAAFECGEHKLVARLITGQFPNWELIMLHGLPHRIELSADNLTAALKRADVVREQTFKTGVGVFKGGMKFTLAATSLTAEVQDNQRGAFSESLAATSNLNGDSVDVGFNPDYLRDFLATGEGSFICEWKDALSQFLFTWPNGNFKYVLMPVRL